MTRPRLANLLLQLSGLLYCLGLGLLDLCDGTCCWEAWGGAGAMVGLGAVNLRGGKV